MNVPNAEQVIQSAMAVGFIVDTRAQSPNDLKLSDRRSGRGTCRWAERGRWSAAGAVTAQPVRCSAWFGDVGFIGAWVEELPCKASATN